MIPTHSPSEVIRYHEDGWEIPKGSIKAKSRQNWIVQARMACIIALRDEHKMSFPDIGRYLGGRDHSSIMHLYRKGKERKV